MASLVPSKRLLIYVASLLPLGVLPAVNPALTPVAVILGCLALLPVVADGVRAQKLLVGVAIQLQPVIRLCCNRPGEITVTVTQQGNSLPQISVGVDLPPSIETDSEIVTVPLTTGYERFAFPLAVVPTRRGLFPLSLAMFAARSRFGFWEVRQAESLSTEIRVYPNLQMEQKSLAPLFLPRAAAGIHIRRQVGQGREFEKLREYLPGDSMDMIHWKATAKRQIPMSKLYQVERVQEVYAVVDAARLSGQSLPGAENEQRLEAFIRASLVMGTAARHQGDLFGLLTFSHRVDSFLRAKGGAGHFNVCRDHLCMLEMRTVSPDYRELTIFIRQKLKKRALLVFMTSLDDPVLAEELLKSLELITRHHLVVVMVMAPKTARPLFSDEQVTSGDDIRRNLVGHLQDQALRTLEREFHHRGIIMVRSDNGALSSQVVQQYLTVKTRQML
ncbi:MAG: DUF58 domain-containing protein [Thermodesulfobacteriota bacterium]